MTDARSGFCISATAAGAEGFQLLELSVGGKGTGSAGIEGGNQDEGEDGDSENMVLLSVRGDGRVFIDGGGGVIVKDGDLEVAQGDATFKVLRVGNVRGWCRRIRCSANGCSRSSTQVLATMGVTQESHTYALIVA